MFNNLSQITVLKEPERKPIDLRELIASIAKKYEDNLANQGIRLETEISEDCPPMMVDLEQVTELFINLMQNSLQATNGEGVIAIRAVHETANHRVKIKFSDTGCGISYAALQHIFKPFISGKQGGMGLGLAICKRIVEDHGGSIQVNSVTGRGTIFDFTLPLVSSSKIAIKAPDSLHPTYSA